MSNYKGIVSKVERVVEIQGADKIQVAVVLGEYTIVSKEIKVGDIGILFPAGTQLSVDYCSVNNLFRDKEKNSDKSKSGFFDDNRKVRCQKFMGVKSEAYFAPLDSVYYTGVDPSVLTPMFAFEELNGVKVCQKFFNPNTQKIKSEKGKKVSKKAQAPFFYEHVETSQYKYEKHKIQKGDLISIQAKGHGSSGRSGLQLVQKQLPTWKEWVNKLIPVFKPSKVYEHVVGTRRVLLDKPEKEGFHGSEAWRFEIASKIEPYLTNGMTCYYEIVGYANSKPIMATHSMSKIKDKKYQKKYGDVVTYKYNCMEGCSDFYIYRITYTTDSGEVIDFTQPQLVKWCNDRGLKPSLDVVEPFIFDGDFDKLDALVEELTERPDVLTEDFRDPSHPSEGIVIRIDNGDTTPLFLKSKSFLFKVLEGIAQEDGAVDEEEIS